MVGPSCHKSHSLVYNIGASYPLVLLHVSGIIAVDILSGIPVTTDLSQYRSDHGLLSYVDGRLYASLSNREASSCTRAPLKFLLSVWTVSAPEHRESSLSQSSSHPRNTDDSAPQGRATVLHASAAPCTAGARRR